MRLTEFFLEERINVLVLKKNQGIMLGNTLLSNQEVERLAELEQFFVRRFNNGTLFIVSEYDDVILVPKPFKRFLSDKLVKMVESWYNKPATIVEVDYEPELRRCEEWKR